MTPTVPTPPGRKSGIDPDALRKAKEAEAALEEQKPQIADQARMIDDTGREIDDLRTSWMETEANPRWDTFAAHVTGIEDNILRHLCNFRALSFIAEEDGEEFGGLEQMRELTLKLARSKDGQERHKLLLSVYAEGIVFGWLLHQKAAAAEGEFEGRIQELEAVIKETRTIGGQLGSMEILEEWLEGRVKQLRGEIETEDEDGR